MKIYVNTKSFKLLIAKKNLSDKEIAGQMNITNVHFSNIKNAKIPVSPDIRRRILAQFPGLLWDKLFRIEE